MTAELLPSDTEVVPLVDGMDWTSLDVFTWIAYREPRLHSGSVESVQFPRSEWARDWLHWPPGNLASALGEIATGVLCLHADGSFDEALTSSDREWARKVITTNCEAPRELGRALASDLKRFDRARIDYKMARQDLHLALRMGRLQARARRAHGRFNPNRNADYELLGVDVFTLQPREVDESGWVGVQRSDDGPWWDEARFKPEQVLALWPAGEAIGHHANAPVLFPNAPRISPWVAAAWKAFRTLDVPNHICRHRSFDGGTQRLPDETRVEYAARLEQHQSFDAAEREVMDLLASGRVSAVGLPPAAPASHHPARTHVDVPPYAFLSDKIAFGSDGELIARLPIFDRLLPPLDVRGSGNSPEYPLWFDLLIEGAGLREALGVADEKPGTIAVQVTIADEYRLLKWLETEMGASRHRSPGKGAMKKRALIAGHCFSGAGFNRVWAKAITASGAVAWSAPGAKSKSNGDLIE